MFVRVDIIHFYLQEGELEGRPSDADSSSSEDEETWREIRRERRNLTASKQSTTGSTSVTAAATEVELKTQPKPPSVRTPKQSKKFVVFLIYVLALGTGCSQLP